MKELQGNRHEECINSIFLLNSALFFATFSQNIIYAEGRIKSFINPDSRIPVTFLKRLINIIVNGILLLNYFLDYIFYVYIERVLFLSLIAIH